MKRLFRTTEVGAIAQELLASVPRYEDRASIVALSGPLGAGKTTLTQALAHALGVAERVVSPTFVVAKWYETTHRDFDTLVHIDAYRIEDESELVPLGFSTLVQQANTLIVIEWPEKIPVALSSLPVFLCTLSHEGEERSIQWEPAI